MKERIIIILAGEVPFVHPATHKLDVVGVNCQPEEILKTKKLGYIEYNNCEFAFQETTEDDSYAILFGKLQKRLHGKDKAETIKIINQTMSLKLKMISIRPLVINPNSSSGHPPDYYHIGWNF